MDFTAVAKEKTGHIYCKKEKSEFFCIAKGKTGPMCSSKEKRGFCSKQKIDFEELLRKNQPYL